MKLTTHVYSTQIKLYVFILGLLPTITVFFATLKDAISIVPNIAIVLNTFCLRAFLTNKRVSLFITLDSVRTLPQQTMSEYTDVGLFKT